MGKGVRRSGKKGEPQVQAEQPHGARGEVVPEGKCQMHLSSAASVRHRVASAWVRDSSFVLICICHSLARKVTF